MVKIEKCRKIRFALIGCGRIGVRHAEHINNLGELKAVCDIVPEKAESFGKKYSAASYTDLAVLLEKE